MKLAARPDDPRELEQRRGATRPAASVPAPAGQGGGGKDLETAITVLRARIDEEFRISERLDAKSRQAFALAAAFFAVVQTVTFGSFAQSSVSSDEKVGMLAAALIAGLALVVVAHRLTNGEELLDEDDVKPEAIVEWCNEAAGRPEYVSARLVGELAHVARRRADSNVIRDRNYESVAFATRWALILAGVELLVAIIVRI
jgi:hypothetical protein